MTARNTPQSLREAFEALCAMRSEARRTVFLSNSISNAELKRFPLFPVFKMSDTRS